MKETIKFRGFHAGPVIASAMIAVGIEDILKVLSWPFAAALTVALNQISKTGRLGIPVIVSSSLPMVLGASVFVTGAILVALGLYLASWLDSESS